MSVWWHRPVDITKDHAWHAFPCNGGPLPRGNEMALIRPIS